MSRRETIYARVSEMLVQALNVAADRIAPAATLQRDLGAESIDLMDIAFRLEREFGIRIERDELFPEMSFLRDPDFARDGRLTEQGLAELRARMPFADLGAFAKDPRLDDLGDLFTVGMITCYVEGKLGGPNGN